MKLFLDNGEYWIKDDALLPIDFYQKTDNEKITYFLKNNLLHRENGPAVIWKDKTEFWILNGKYHRIDGPAIFNPGSFSSYSLNSKEVNEDIFKKIQNSSKEDLLIYMALPEYKDYLSLIEHRLK